MSLLGVLIHQTTISRAGDDLKGVTLATLAHSLPATNPEVLLPIMRSVQAVAGNGSNGLPELLGLGGNASIATIGYAMASCVSCPTVMYDVLAIVFHSVIR